MTTIDEAHDRFRDELASVHRDGRRKWVYARQPRGRFYRARTIVSVILLAFLISAPFITFRGQPLVLLNVLERRFVLFGLLFWPQDFYLVVLVALVGLVTLALSTAAVGRVWCGWLCPQTVFLEMVFRRLEYLIDGSAEQQLRRARGRRTWATVARLLAKHAIFFTLSFAIANLFLAYVVGAPALYTIVTDPPSQHIGGLVAITIFSLLFYGVFARFREQACTLACPYGRVMSALIDTHTITVTYDARRGEPRGRQNDTDARGDCINCAQCVTVCPTGIDIRNGIQLECVNCTACIDACDDVMTRIRKPRGLIRLTSIEAVRTGRLRWLTPRVRAYAAVWCVLASALVFLLVRRPSVEVQILRQPGALYTRLDDGRFANFYNVQIINRSPRAHALAYRVLEPEGATVIALGPIGDARPYAVGDSRLMLQMPAAHMAGLTTPVRFEVRSDGAPLQTIYSTFLGPGQ